MEPLLQIRDGKAIITLPLTEPQASKSGKTFLIAGTGGFVKTDQKHRDKQVSIAVNITIPK